MTPEQRHNLQTLATFLATNAASIDFDMNIFNDPAPNDADSETTWSPDEVDTKHTCGTTACALGWGPAAGIRPSMPNKSWWLYAKHELGAADDGDGNAMQLRAWRAFFSSDWADLDNTALGASKRIQHFLDTGEYPDPRDA